MSKKTIASLFLICSFMISTAGFAGTNNSANQAMTFQVVKAKISLNKKDIQSMKLVKSQSGIDAIEVNLTKAAAKQLQELTAGNIHKEMQILVKDKIINHAIIQGNLGQQFQISFKSNKQAEKIYSALKR